MAPGLFSPEASVAGTDEHVDEQVPAQQTPPAQIVPDGAPVVEQTLLTQIAAWHDEGGVGQSAAVRQGSGAPLDELDELLDVDEEDPLVELDVELVDELVPLVELDVDELVDPRPEELDVELLLVSLAPVPVGSRVGDAEQPRTTDMSKTRMVRTFSRFFGFIIFAHRNRWRSVRKSRAGSGSRILLVGCVEIVLLNVNS